MHQHSTSPPNSLVRLTLVVILHTKPDSLIVRVFHHFVVHLTKARAYLAYYVIRFSKARALPEFYVGLHYVSVHTSFGDEPLRSPFILG